MRLDKLLAQCGYGTRTEVKVLLKKKQVTVNDAVETSAKRQVEAHEVRVMGEAVELPPSELTLIMHKPVGYACTHNPAESPLIYDLIPEAWAKVSLSSAGRLDRETSGLLILSTDGQLLHQLVHPKKKVEKRYRVGYEEELASDAVERALEGIELKDEERPCLPAKLEIHAPSPDGLGQATLTLREGRYHQVRRMIAAVGGHVVTLHRDEVGGLVLPEALAEGECRVLTQEELDQLVGC